MEQNARPCHRPLVDPGESFVVRAAESGEEASAANLRKNFNYCQNQTCRDPPKVFNMPRPKILQEGLID
jgi:hypothetical protein